MAYLELKDIYFNYSEDDNFIFKGFNVLINKGECILISGDNGSGKSTLFKIINGLLFPQSGEFIFNEQKITEKWLKKSANSKSFHKQIGYLFQNPDVMLFNSNVYDEIAFGPRQMAKSDNETDIIVKDCMRLFDIENLSDKAPYHLSGGQKKRVAFASVLALNPDVLILDEPFSGLDKKGRLFLIDLFKELKEAGKTLIIASHEKDLLAELTDRNIEL